MYPFSPQPPVGPRTCRQGSSARLGVVSRLHALAKKHPHRSPPTRLPPLRLLHGLPHAPALPAPPQDALPTRGSSACLLHPDENLTGASPLQIFLSAWPPEARELLLVSPAHVIASLHIVRKVFVSLIRESKRGQAKMDVYAKVMNSVCTATVVQCIAICSCIRRKKTK